MIKFIVIVFALSTEGQMQILETQEVKDVDSCLKATFNINTQTQFNAACVITKVGQSVVF
jgi:hypothetical protein